MSSIFIQYTLHNHTCFELNRSRRILMPLKMDHLTSQITRFLSLSIRITRSRRAGINAISFPAEAFGSQQEWICGDIAPHRWNFFPCCCRCQITHAATIIWNPGNRYRGGIGEDCSRCARTSSYARAAAIRGTSLQFDRIPREITPRYVP